MCGRFSSTQASPARTAAGMMATEAFFAPLMVTVPSSRFPPLISYHSFCIPSLVYRNPSDKSSGFDFACFRFRGQRERLLLFVLRLLCKARKHPFVCFPMMCMQSCNKTVARIASVPVIHTFYYSQYIKHFSRYLSFFESSFCNR